MSDACVHSEWTIIPVMFEAATDEEHSPAVMRVVGLKGAAWWLAMALLSGQGMEKHFFDRF